MSKKVLILSGSPRKGGNSDLLCDAFMRGAVEAGNAVEKVRVSEKKIGYCSACYYCVQSGGVCAKKDDIRRKIEEEENPYHRQHIQEINEMMDEKIRTQVPQLIRQHSETQRISIETYLNGRHVRTNNDIVKGIRSMIVDAFKRAGMGR